MFSIYGLKVQFSFLKLLSASEPNRKKMKCKNWKMFLVLSRVSDPGEFYPNQDPDPIPIFPKVDLRRPSKKLLFSFDIKINIIYILILIITLVNKYFCNFKNWIKIRPNLPDSDPKP